VTNNMLVNTANQRFTKKDYEKLREKAKGWANWGIIGIPLFDW
jgi:hypothetical protein